MEQEIEIERENVVISGSGTSDYEELENKPSINSVELSGNKSLSDLGIDQDFVKDNNYVHTDNNYTTLEKNKLSNLENYDDTDIKQDISDLETNKADKTDIPVIPENLSDFNNDVGYITSYTETDPIFSNSAASSITNSDITNWNGKQSELVSGTNIKTINNESILGSGNIEISGGGGTDSFKIFEMNCYNPSTEEKEKMDEICDLIDNGEKNIILYNIGTSTAGASKWLIYDHTSYGQYFFLVLGTSSSESPIYPSSYGYTYKEVNNYYIKYIKSNQQFANSQDGAVFKYLEANRNYTKIYTPTYDGSPTPKKYVDKTHYENMTGYDATKTQILKNINGTLTWVDE